MPSNIDLSAFEANWELAFTHTVDSYLVSPAEPPDLYREADGKYIAPTQD